jgi:hypothetical protein
LTIVSVLALVAVGCGSEGETTTTAVGATGVTGAAGVAENRDGRGQDPPEPPDATEIVRSYYELVNAGDYRTAWDVLPNAVQVESGGFEQWRQGYATTISTRARNLDLSASSEDEAVVTLDVFATDRDACGDRIDQEFSGRWSLRKEGDSWLAEDIDIEKVSGGTPTVSASECAQDPPPQPAPATSKPEPSGDCVAGYSPCLSPASDYDCEGGSGDGPAYTGTVQVSGSDPYGLDADGDGVGCE